VVSKINQPEQIPSPSEKFDGGGKVVMTIPLNAGGSYERIWRDYKRRCESRAPEKPQQQPRRNTIRRRLPMED
jgi:hypothetical protein